MLVRKFVHPLRVAVAGILAASAMLAASAPANAVPTATITLDPVDPGIVVLSASAAPSSIILGFDTTTFPVDTATFELLFDGFASWPDSCEPAPPSPFDLQVIHCPASELHSLRASFGPGNDTLHMESVCYDTIWAGFGDGGNTMLGLEECPTEIHVTSGAGDDVVHMASGGGTVSQGAGNDEVFGGAGADVVSAGPGNDRLVGRGGNDTLLGDDGNDAISGGPGNDVEGGGPGDDVIGGTQATGFGSDDDQGADAVSGGPGADTVLLDAHLGGGMTVNLDGVANDGTAGEGDNFHADLETISGTMFDDTIVGSPAAETLEGWSGNDTILGGGGNDAIDGESGDDAVFGGDGNDTVQGGVGNDQVTGDGGTDNLFGDYATCCVSNGNDKVFAVDGVADQINCGGGADAVEADQLDVIGSDGNQLCESISRTTVTPPGTPPGTPVPPPATLTVKASVVGKATRSEGVAVTVTCSTTCGAATRLEISKKVAKKYGLGRKVVIGRGKGASLAGGTFKIKTKVKAKARRKLARAGTIRAVVVLAITDAGGTQQTRKLKVTLKR